MARNGFKVLDSDIHIIEPPDLWQRYIDPEFRDRAPRGLSDTIGNLYLEGPDGRPWGRTPTPEQDQRMYSGKEHIMNEEKYRSFDQRGWTGEVQLEAMDAEGIDVAVVYPSRGLYVLTVPNLDPSLAAAIARAYNDWLHEFCQTDPDRLIGAGMISPFDIENAVSESLRCVNELGFKRVFLRPNEVNDRNWYDSYYEPLWTTLEELQVPLGFHEGVASGLPQAGDKFKENFMLQHVFSHPVELMMATASFCGGGILERHPKLRVAFLEGNCSWVPFLLWRLDEHCELWGDVYAADLKMLPSEYYKRQCFASVEADEDLAKYVIDHMGNNRLVFSTDFPHPDSKWPGSVERFLQLPITDEDKKRILWDNCAQYYDIA